MKRAPARNYTCSKWCQNILGSTDCNKERKRQAQLNKSFVNDDILPFVLPCRANKQSPTEVSFSDMVPKPSFFELSIIIF